VPTPPKEVAHLLRRAGFGGSRAHITELAALDRAALVDHVLDLTNALVDTPPASVSNPSVSGWDRYVDLCNWWYNRMATSPTPIVEKMTLFWHGHFTTNHFVTQNPRWTYDQNALFREHALGDLRVLTPAMAVQPAMLTYLNNRVNVKGGAQNNFARELMELFTIGPGYYTENDVMEVGRAWTGHTVNDTTMSYEFKPEWHDDQPKTIFGITKNWNGPDVIDEIFTSPEKRALVARFIVTKLWSFFAYAEPEDPIVRDLSAAFISSSFNVGSVLRAMFLRDEFYGPRALRALVRTPTEYIVAVLRGTGMSADELHAEWYAERMGQSLFNPPTVKGWGRGQYWLTTTAMGARAQLVERIDWTLAARNAHPLVNRYDLAPAALVDLAATFIDVDMTTGTRAALTEFVTQTRAGHNGWTEPHLLTLTLLAPEFHVS
jgi:uncharacterized protein (DUF1800 family)